MRRRRQDVLELQVRAQRRTLAAVAGRLDLVQGDADRALEAQTDLESRVLDLEQRVFSLAPSTWRQWQSVCGACGFMCRSEMEMPSVIYCPRCGQAQTRTGEPRPGACPKIRLLSSGDRSPGPVAS